MQIPSLYIDRLTQFRRYELPATYGEYAEMFCHEMSIPLQDAPECRTHCFEAIPGWGNFWFKVLTEMQAIKTGDPIRWSQFANGELAGFSEQELLTADGGETLTPGVGIFKAATMLAGNTREALEITERMVTAYHALGGDQHILWMVEHDEFGKLRNMLRGDMQSLPFWMGPGHKGGIPALREIIEAVVDRYFYRDPLAPYDARLWEVRGKARIKAEEIRAARRRREERMGRGGFDPGAYDE